MNSTELGSPTHSFNSPVHNNEWKSNNEFTIEAPTNAFGELFFSNTSKITSKVSNKILKFFRVISNTVFIFFN